MVYRRFGPVETCFCVCGLIFNGLRFSLFSGEVPAGPVQMPTGRFFSPTAGLPQSTGELRVPTEPLRVSTGRLRMPTARLRGGWGKLPGSSGRLRGATGELPLFTGGLRGATGRLSVVSARMQAATGVFRKNGGSPILWKGCATVGWDGSSGPHSRAGNRVVRFRRWVKRAGLTIPYVKAPASAVCSEPWDPHPAFS